jgi:dipeptidyl-peptidase-4
MVDNVVSKSPRITFAYPKVGEKNSATRLGGVISAGREGAVARPARRPREHYLPHADWTPDGSHILVQQFNGCKRNCGVAGRSQHGKAKAVFTEKDAAWLENENPSAVARRRQELRG